ncbi:MAG: oxidoreductase [Robiginitomaculum sp.]|nr:MAG: oxidoreductase [Robiginitomaculum sp.]
MSDRLLGKTAIITGAGNGIGQGCALMFACQGAHVIGVERDVEAAQATLKIAAQEGLDIEFEAPVDLLKPVDVTSMFERIGEKHGAVDILLNAAAFAIFNWIEDLSYEDWQTTLRGELDIVFLPTKAAWPLLKKSGQASIINFASANAYNALEGSPALAHCAGKGGVLAMTRQLAMEGAPHNIRANTISPGFIKTAATIRHLKADTSFKDMVLAKNMIQRLGEPEDIAYMAVYLASNEAGYTTGADFSVDAGATAW